MGKRSRRNACKTSLFNNIDEAIESSLVFTRPSETKNNMTLHSKYQLLFVAKYSPSIGLKELT
jgi:hypothetical protein